MRTAPVRWAKCQHYADFLVGYVISQLATAENLSPELAAARARYVRILKERRPAMPFYYLRLLVFVGLPVMELVFDFSESLNFDLLSLYLFVVIIGSPSIFSRPFSDELRDIRMQFAAKGWKIGADRRGNVEVTRLW